MTVEEIDTKIAELQRQRAELVDAMPYKAAVREFYAARGGPFSMANYPSPTDYSTIAGLKAAYPQLRKVMEAEPDVDLDDDGWIAWEGGECPVSRGAYVEVRLASGHTYIGCAGYTDWGLVGSPAAVAAYRIR